MADRGRPCRHLCRWAAVADWLPAGLHCPDPCVTHPVRLPFASAQERCPGVLPAMKAAIREQATSLSADLAKELKDVKDIIATLRGIRQIGGMPRVRTTPLR